MYNRDGVLKASYGLIALGVLIIMSAGAIEVLSPTWRPYARSALGPLLGLNVLATLYLFMYIFIQEFKDLRAGQRETEEKIVSSRNQLRSIIDYLRTKFGKEAIPEERKDA